jgi:hypothetical protein
VTVNIEEWILDRGEFYQMDQIAISPPGGYAGLAGTANVNGMDGTDGNYVPAAKTVIGYFMTAFPNTPVVLTKSPPYATGQGQTDSQTIDDDLRAAHGDHYGVMVASRQSTCQPHAFSVSFPTYPKGSQAILPTGAGIYQEGANCQWKSPYPLQDLWEASFDVSDKYWETYQGDIESADPVTGDPGIAAMAAYERARVRFANPQVEQRAKIQRRQP